MDLKKSPSWSPSHQLYQDIYLILKLSYSHHIFQSSSINLRSNSVSHDFRPTVTPSVRTTLLWHNVCVKSSALWSWFQQQNPLVMTNSLLLKMAISSWFYPSKMVIFHSYVDVYQREMVAFSLEISGYRRGVLSSNIPTQHIAGEWIVIGEWWNMWIIYFV